MESNNFDVIIIGSGPAGLTASIYATRAALSTLILAGTSLGGQLMLTTEVDNFPGFPEGVMGPELMQKMRKQAERFGAKVINADVEKVIFTDPPFKIFADGKEYTSKAVIIATGAETIWLGLENEWKLIGRGVSSCAPCDAPFFKEKKVIVVGGGDSAMEEALVLAKFATEVTIVHRRDKFRASDIMQKKVLDEPKIKVMWNSEVVDVLGEQKVLGVKIKNSQTNETQDFPVDGMFVAIGHSPMSKIFAGHVDLDEKGYVKKFPREGVEFSTSVEGVFVAGDVHDHHYRQAVTAAGFGCQAAMDCEKWLEGREKVTSS